MADFNVSVPQEDLDRIDNTALEKAIDNMRTDFSDEARENVVNKVVFETSFFVPAIFDSSTELIQNEEERLQFAERPQAKFVLVENPDGEKYVPAFTSQQYLDEFRDAENNGCQAFVMSFPDIASVVETFEPVQGFVINPFNHNLPFPKDFLMAIKKNLMEQVEKAKEAENDGAASITMSTNNN